jgi:hypothetical protein
MASHSRRPALLPTPPANLRIPTPPPTPPTTAEQSGQAHNIVDGDTILGWINSDDDVRQAAGWLEKELPPERAALSSQPHTSSGITPADCAAGVKRTYTALLSSSSVSASSSTNIGPVSAVPLARPTLPSYSKFVNRHMAAHMAEQIIKHRNSLFTSSTPISSQKVTCLPVTMPYSFYDNQMSRPPKKLKFSCAQSCPRPASR